MLLLTLLLLLRPHFAILQLRAISTGKASQVKACHAMRGALELLDFEDASINDMKRMLLQVCVDTYWARIIALVVSLLFLSVGQSKLLVSGHVAYTEPLHVGQGYDS